MKITRYQKENSIIEAIKFIYRNKSGLKIEFDGIENDMFFEIKYFQIQNKWTYYFYSKKEDLTFKSSTQIEFYKECRDYLKKNKFKSDDEDELSSLEIDSNILEENFGKTDKERKLKIITITI